MQHRIRTGIKSTLIAAWSVACLMTMAAPGYAADDSAQAARIFQAYCDIEPERDLRGVPLDPKLTDEQADQFRTDSYNDTEKKLAVMRQDLMKLDHAAVESMLHKKMEKQERIHADTLMCVLEIVARSLPQEYEAYARLIKPGADESGFVDYIRQTFLGKSAALHEDLDPNLR